MITPLGGVRIVSTPNYYVAVPYSTDEQVALAESEGFLRIDRNSGNFTKVKGVDTPFLENGNHQFIFWLRYFDEKR